MNSINIARKHSRRLLAVIASFGVIITGYLTYSKLMQASLTCPTHGCDKVLASPYASIENIPLSLFGFLAYLAMIAFAIAPLMISGKVRSSRTSLHAVSQQMLLLGATAMALFSLYLLYLMGFVIHAFCIYCLTSAGLSFALFFLVIIGFQWKDIGYVIFTSTVMSIIIGLMSLILFGLSSSQIADSGPAEVDLAKHLTQIEAKMYGASWCDHCRQQKQLFGNEAAQKLKYIECDSSVENAQPERCNSAGIMSYPTWEINGQYYLGVKSLHQLAKLSMYQGDLDFQAKN